jgi:hypothetical protein
MTHGLFIGSDLKGSGSDLNAAFASRLRKTTKILSQDRRCPGRDSKYARLEYEYRRFRYNNTLGDNNVI